MALAERLMNLVWIAIGLAVMGYAFQLRIWVAGKPEPGFVPLLAGACLAGAGALLLVRRGGAPDAPFWPDRRGAARAGLVLAGLVAITLLMPIAGFPIAAAAVMVLLLRSIEKQGWLLVLVLAAGSSLGVYLVFTRLLGTALPRGPVWF